MSLMIVPEPLFDSNMAVEAYRLCSHDGTKMLGIKDSHLSMGDAFSHPSLDLVESIGLEPFTGGKLLFVTLTPMQLSTGVPTNTKIRPDRLVCVIPHELASDAQAAQRIRDLASRGYRIALDGFPEVIHLSILRHIEYVLLNYSSPAFRQKYADLQEQMPGARAVIDGVPDSDAYSSLRNDGRAFFSGDFYSRPVTREHTPLSPLKVNALHLLSKVSQEDFDLQDIVYTIERDPYLTVSLLKFINSSASGLRRKVDSIRQGVAILGQKAARQWATIALSVSLGEDRPSEITRLALLRAKFAEDIAVVFELGVFQSGLFMAGLFSLLDVMLEKPMEEAIADVAVDERVKQALLEKKGPFAPVMELIYAYERADWDRVSILMIQHNTDMDHISKAYLDALVWYRNLLLSIDSPIL